MKMNGLDSSGEPISAVRTRGAGIEYLEITPPRARDQRFTKVQDGAIVSSAFVVWQTTDEG